MKICVIPRGWPSKENPQLGIFERDQAIALSKLGHQVYSLILDLRPSINNKKIRITKEQEEGVVKYCFYAGFGWIEKLKKISPQLQYRVVEFLFPIYSRK